MGFKNLIYLKSLGLMFFVLFFGQAGSAACVPGLSSKVIGGESMYANTCVPNPQSLSNAEKFCVRERGSSVINLGDGSYGCSRKYPRGYSQFCEEHFQVSTNRVKGAGGLSTISSEDMARCKAGKAIAGPVPIADVSSENSAASNDDLPTDDNKICTDVGAESAGDGERFAADRCVCSENKGTTILIADVKKNNGTRCPVTSPTSVDTSSPRCLAQLREHTQQCAAKSEVAVNKCDAKNPETEKTDYLKGALTVISGLGTILQAKGKMIGAAETCLRGGLISATGYSAYNLLKEDCSKERSLCDDSCASAEAEYKLIQQKCSADFAGDNLNIVMQKAEDYRTQFTNSWNVTCKKKAGDNADSIAKLLSDLNKAGIDSAKCNCQLTAGGAANYNLPGNMPNACSNVLGPAACLENPSLPGCSITTPIAGCSGENAKTKMCACALNPNSAQCGNNIASNVSGVAGPGQNFNGISTGGSNFKPSGGSGGIGNLDDSTGATTSSSDRSRSNADSPFAVAAGGGGGGSGGSAGSDSENSSAAVTGAEEPKSGIGGLFSNLKSGLANVLGIGDGKKPGPGKSFGEKKKNEIDPNAWSPKSGVRGVANSGIVGGKNRDIFKMIQNQYGEQYHTLMTIPTPANQGLPK